MAVALQKPRPGASQSEDELWLRRTAGDRGARATLIESHVRLAQMLARRYARRGEPIEDLEQVACVGLVHAVDRFDPERGTSFTTFAIPTILGELKRHFRDRTWAVRMPRELRDASTTVERTRDSLAAELGRSPSPVEVAKAAGISVEQVVEATEAMLAYRCESLDRPAFGDDGEALTMGERIGSGDPELRRAEDGILLEQLAASALSLRDREVVRLRFREDLLQREIADRVGVSQMQVSRILRDAIARLQWACD